jgi:hypothetical protein
VPKGDLPCIGLRRICRPTGFFSDMIVDVAAVKSVILKARRLRSA